MSDKNKEYEEFLKLYEKEHPLNTYENPKELKPKASVTQIKVPKHIKHKSQAAKKRIYMRLICILSAFIILFLTVFLIIKLCGVNLKNSGNSGKDMLAGTWNLDNITVYQFDGSGNGSLNLPANTYPFTYKINGKNLSIDFISESATDTVYEFTVNNKKLLLVSTNKNNETTYELTKQTKN